MQLNFMIISLWTILNTKDTLRLASYVYPYATKIALLAKKVQILTKKIAFRSLDDLSSSFVSSFCYISWSKCRNKLKKFVDGGNGPGYSGHGYNQVCMHTYMYDQVYMCTFGVSMSPILSLCTKIHPYWQDVTSDVIIILCMDIISWVSY